MSCSRRVRVVGVRKGEVGSDLSYIIFQLGKQAVRDRREREAREKAKRTQREAKSATKRRRGAHG